LEDAMAARRVSDAAGATRGVLRERREGREIGKPGVKAEALGRASAGKGPSAQNVADVADVADVAGVAAMAEAAERAERFKAWLEASPPEWREFFDAP
jgi:hypothetical protein